MRGGVFKLCRVKVGTTQIPSYVIIENCFFRVSNTLYLSKCLNMIGLVCLDRSKSLFTSVVFPVRKILKILFRMKCMYMSMNILHFEK